MSAMGKIVCGNVKIVCRMGVYVLDLPYYHPGPRPDRSGSMEDLPRVAVWIWLLLASVWLFGCLSVSSCLLPGSGRSVFCCL